MTKKNGEKKRKNWIFYPEPIVPRKYIEKLLTTLEEPVHKLVTEVDVPNRAELAVRFVAQAAECFFLKYPVSYTKCTETFFHLNIMPLKLIIDYSKKTRKLQDRFQIVLLSCSFYHLSEQWDTSIFLLLVCVINV